MTSQTRELRDTRATLSAKIDDYVRKLTMKYRNCEEMVAPKLLALIS